MITAVPVIRDADGYWQHPHIPWDTIPEETDNAPHLLRLGIELCTVSMASEDDALSERHADGDTSAVLEWEPSPPTGGGWFMLLIHDCEEGAVAWWGRNVTRSAMSTETTDFSDRQYLAYDPTAGDKDDGGVSHRVVSIVRARKSHLCWQGQHQINPGERYLRETAIIAGEGRKSSAICLACIAAWYREIGEVPEG